MACIVEIISTPGLEDQEEGMVTESQDRLCGESILQELLPLFEGTASPSNPIGREPAVPDSKGALPCTTFRSASQGIDGGRGEWGIDLEG